MTPKQKRRFMAVGLILLGVAAAGALILTAFQDNLMLFHSPSEIADGKAPTTRKFRVGGLVVPGSVERAPQSLRVRFQITDNARSVPVEYEGLLPDLFREGQGIVADGRLDGGGVFVADEVLAKHDENYMPPEVADALKAAGSDPRLQGLKQTTVQ
ncbi:MAG: cytochrome c maturation protein CcmE [Chromatiales bacterium]|nr:cytochrome c maturation protein CcmE [Chromatiales bacterium]